MSIELKLRVVTPSGPVVDLVAHSVTACSEVGEFCVLPEHQPILASLKPGRFMFETKGEKQVYAMDVGFFEGGLDHVNVMTQHCVSKDDILASMDELEQDLAALTADMNEMEADSPSRATAQANVDWIEAQLIVAKE